MIERIITGTAMAFTFQINDNLHFIHDDYLLARADENRSPLYQSFVSPVSLVELIEDDTKLMGYTIQKVSDIDTLPTLKLKKNDHIILDFSDHHVGKISMKLTHSGSPMDAPLHMKLRFAEVPAELASHPENYDGWLSSSWIQEEYIHIDVLPCTLTLPRRYSFRYLEITVLDTSPKWTVSFDHVMVSTESSADTDSLTPVSVDDPLLQRIVNVSIRTLAECMQDVFEDGPKRDRRLWLGDLRLQALANYATFDNKELVKRCLYLFAGMSTEEGKISANVFVKPAYVPDDTFLFDYSLFFISVLYDYLEVHDEAELLQDLYTTCKKQMDISLSYVNEDGKLILDPNYPVFVDWSQEFNKDTAAQAIVMYVLKQFIALSERMHEDTAVYQNTLDQMIDYSLTHLYDKEKKLFISHSEYNIASQVWMVISGILSNEENHVLMEETVKTLFPIRNIATPYMYHCVTEALFIAGMKDEAVSLLKNYWGKMIDLGADTFFEAFDPDQPHYSPYGDPIVSSFCHAWSCTPVYLIQKYLK